MLQTEQVVSLYPNTITHPNQLLFVVFAWSLNAYDVHVHLLDAKLKSWGFRGENISVCARILKEWVLPQGAGVIAAVLPLVPIQIVRKLGQFFIAGDQTPVNVVVENWRGIVVPVNGPGKCEALHVVKEVNVVKVLE